MSCYVGIDLGTTNSVSAVGSVMADGSFRPEPIYIPQTGEDKQIDYTERLLSSVLYAEDSERHYVGKYAKAMMGQAGDRVIAWAKRDMGKSDKKPTLIDGKEYTPEYVSSYYLTVIKRAVERLPYIDRGNLTGATITVPASFNYQQIGATRVAAQLAGFNDEEISFISEPTAALLDFINQQNNMSHSARAIDFSEPKLVLVFDLGGGTCDVSIIKAKVGNDRNIDLVELQPSRYSEMGGIDFDEKLTIMMMNDFIIKERIDWGNLDKGIKQWLTVKFMNVAEKAKFYFSTEIHRMQSTPQANFTEENFDQITFSYEINLDEKLANKRYSVNISKAEYDRVVKSLLEENETGTKNIIDPINSALRKNNLKKEQIDSVLMVGGMTEFRTVQKVIENYFDPENRNRKILYGALEPMFSVAKGAAVYNYYRDKIRIKSLNLDQSPGLEKQNVAPNIGIVEVVLPETIFIELSDGDEPLIERGTKAPYERVIKDKFYVADPYGMRIPLWQGENEYDINPFKLNEGHIIFDSPQKPGTPVNLRVAFDTNREIAVKAWLANDESQVVDVRVGNATLAKEEIQAIAKSRGEINKSNNSEEVY